jgi:uncharacterized protein
LLLSSVPVIVVSAWKSNYKSNQTITVTGSAKKQIVSDLAVLKGSLSVEAQTAETAYRQLQSQKPILISYLKSKGFAGRSNRVFYHK